MKKLKSGLISGIIIFVVVVAVVIFALIKPNESGQYNDFAKCLTNNEVKMYGAYWCPYCTNQEEMFGNSWKHINYIECSLPNKQGQKLKCKQEGIEGYPTWEFKGGERLSGELSFEILSEKSGCEFKKDQVDN